MRLLAVLALASGCTKSNPAYSGETHFLAVCEGDGACEAGLSCICGVCTRACEGDRDCEPLSSSATCSAPGTPTGSCEPAGATAAACSVACSGDADCAALEGGPACVQGECRGDTGGSCTRDGSLYPDGAADIPAGDGCNSCRCNAGRLACTDLDCASEPGDAGALGGFGTCPPPLELLARTRFVDQFGVAIDSNMNPNDFESDTFIDRNQDGEFDLQDAFDFDMDGTPDDFNGDGAPDNRFYFDDTDPWIPDADSFDDYENPELGVPRGRTPVPGNCPADGIATGPLDLLDVNGNPFEQWQPSRCCMREP